MVQLMVPPLQVFDDYDSLENGYSREFIASSLLTPTSKGACASSKAHDLWVLCKLTRPSKSEFQLCSEDGDFMLCAKRVGECYYISTYEYFPTNVDERALAALVKAGDVPRGVVAVLAPRQHARTGAATFALRLVSAGDARSSAAATPTAPHVEVTPSAIWCAEQNAELRRLSISLPAPDVDAGAHYAHDWRQKPPAPPNARRIGLTNKLPTWNRNLGCLSLHFGRKRVRTSSSKNFLVYTDEVLNDKTRREDADNAVFQLGKLAAKTFALDFRYPINPLQAFAVALTAFQVKHTKVPRARRASSG